MPAHDVAILLSGYLVEELALHRRFGWCERENNSGTKAALIAGRRRRYGRRGVAQAVHYFKNFRRPTLSLSPTHSPSPPCLSLDLFCRPSSLPACVIQLPLTFRGKREDRRQPTEREEESSPPSMQFGMVEREGRRGSFSPQLRVSSLSASDRRPTALQMFRAGREGGE